LALLRARRIRCIDDARFDQVLNGDDTGERLLDLVEKGFLGDKLRVVECPIQAEELLDREGFDGWRNRYVGLTDRCRRCRW